MTSNASKWAKYEEAKRTSLLENHPEDERESLTKLDLETLEYVTSKINNTKQNAPEVVGNARKAVPEKPIDWSDRQNLKQNWTTILSQYKKQPQKQKS